MPLVEQNVLEVMGGDPSQAPQECLYDCVVYQTLHE